MSDIRPDIKVEIQIDWDRSTKGADDYHNDPSLRAPVVLVVEYELYRRENLVEPISHFEKVKEALVALGADPAEISWVGGSEIVAHIIETEEMTKARFAKREAEKEERHKRLAKDSWDRYLQAERELINLGELKVRALTNG